MAADSGAERHVLADGGYRRAMNIRPLDAPLILETANVESVVTDQCDVACGAVLLQGVLMCNAA
eukprot:7394417-Pyramimonas_sp.AAC.1